MPGPTASIVIPTLGRPEYLEHTLRTLAAQARAHEAEVVVVSDGPNEATAELARRYGAELVTVAHRQGVNATRNAGVRAGRGDPVIFLDDDLELPERWLQSLMDAVARCPEYELFGGPIHALLEGGGPHACGREPPPITTLDFGAEDRDAPFVWGANMAVRRRAFARLGLFDASLSGIGDEEEWERRYREGGGRIRYVAQAGVLHRRIPRDSTLRALSGARYRQGRAARANDVSKGTPPSLAWELRTLGGCIGHAARRRCALGLVMAAHCAGRLREIIAEHRS